MSAWRPREHDHLVEPFLAGLRGRAPGEGPTAGTLAQDDRENAAVARRERRRTLLLAAAAAAAIALRMAALALR
jgi:hypothetical protein